MPQRGISGIQEHQLFQLLESAVLIDSGLAVPAPRNDDFPGFFTHFSGGMTVEHASIVAHPFGRAAAKCPTQIQVMRVISCPIYVRVA